MRRQRPDRRSHLRPQRTPLGLLARLACETGLALLLVQAGTAAAAPSLILHNGDIWTVDRTRPTAQAVAIEGGKILKVGRNAEVLRLKGPETRMLDLKGGFVLPGFIDAHTHFGAAAESFFDVRLVDVNDQALLSARLRQAVAEVPPGMWITGYDWGSSAARRGGKGFKPFTPSLAGVDRITPNHPVLLRRFDGAYFINSKGLELTRINRTTPNPANGEYVKDPKTGELTGLLLGSAGLRTSLILPPPNRARALVGARARLRELNGFGITSIQDIARVEEVSSRKLYATNLERYTTELGLLTDLKSRGELTVRVYPILTLGNWRDYAALGIKPGAGDDMLRYGALKLFLDAGLMEEPYAHQPAYVGVYSFRVTEEAALKRDIQGADALGFDVATHVMGDKGHRLLTDWYEAVTAENPPRDRRFRYIHAWYPREREVERAGKLGAIADVSPYQLIQEMDEMEHQLGPRRAAFGFPWRTMISRGVRISFGSDWPGSFDRTNIAPVDPLENMYYAITRRRREAGATQAWRPEQAMTIDEAIEAYTINPAYGSREESIKGSVSEGKLADLVVLSRNIRQIPPEQLLATKVRYTILNGAVIYAANGK